MADTGTTHEAPADTLKARVNELSLADVTDELRSRWKQLEPAAKA